MSDRLPHLWDDEVLEIRTLVGQWAEEIVAPTARGADAALETPADWWAGLAELGLDRGGWPEEALGMGLSWSTVTAVAEALGEADPGLALLWSQHQVAGRLTGGHDLPEDAVVALALGDDEDTEHGAAMMDLVEGGLQGGVEAHGAGLVTHLLTTVQQGDSIQARVVPVVEQERLATSGLRATPLAVWVAAGDAGPPIGERQAVREAAARLLDTAVAGIAAGLTSMARRDTIAFGEQRVQFSTPVTAKEEMRLKLAHMAAGQLSVHALAAAAARAVDEMDGTPQSDRRSASLAHGARLEAMRVAVSAGEESVQMHGGYGYVKEYPAEKHYRDARHLVHVLGGPLATGERLARIVIDE